MDHHVCVDGPPQHGAADGASTKNAPYEGVFCIMRLSGAMAGL